MEKTLYDPAVIKNIDGGNPTNQPVHVVAPTEAPTSDAPTQAPTTTQEPSRGCYATGPIAGQAAMDRWCVTNCAVGRVLDLTLYSQCISFSHFQVL